MIKCQRCNAECSSTSQFCVACGADITNSDSSKRYSSKRLNPGNMVIFLIIFILASLLEYIFFISPLIKCIRARSWEATPCTINSGRLITKSTKGRTLYGLDLSFSYEFNKFKYSSNTYSISENYSDDYGAVKGMLGKYSPGTKALCYVNPSQPFEAVINRDINVFLCFSGLFFGLLIFVGLIGLMPALKSFMGK
jgi:hypothetical protein